MTTKQRIAWYREGNSLSLRRLAMRKRARMKREASLRNTGERLNAWGATPLSAYL